MLIVSIDVLRSWQNHTCVVFFIHFMDSPDSGLPYDDRPSANILDTAEHGGASRKAPAVRGDIQELSFMRVEPAIDDMDRGFLHEIDIENRFGRFLINDLEPGGIGKERQGWTRVQLEAGFEVKCPCIAPKVRHMTSFGIIQVRGDQELRRFAADLNDDLLFALQLKDAIGIAIDIRTNV